MLALVCAILILPVYGACTFPSQIRRVKNPPVPVRIGLNRSVKSSPLLIADSQGFLKSRGFTVDLFLEPSVAGVMDSLNAGLYDMVCIPEFQLVNNIDTAGQWSIIAVLNRNQSRYFVFNTDRLNSFTEIRGKKIGLAAGSAAEYTISRIMTFHGMSDGSVEFLYAPVQDLPEKLASGQADAILVWSPYVSEAVNLMKEKAVVRNAHMGLDMYWLLVVSHSWLESYPDAAVAFLDGLEDSCRYMDSRPAHARELVAEGLRFNVSMVDSEWGEYRFLMELPRTLVTAVEQQLHWRYPDQKGSLPDPVTFINSSYLEEILPARVTLIR